MSPQSATNRSAPVAPWRIGVDVGGTFTDMVLADATGATGVFKVPSEPADPGAGVVAALEMAARTYDLGLARLLHDCTLFVHGSTIATNTILEGKGAKVGLLTTEGFRDSLEIRRSLRDDQWDHRRPYAPVLVPRSRRLSVAGRIDRNGTEVAPLELGDVEAAMETFAAEGVEAVAISLINSFLNPAHEQACAGVARGNGRDNDAWVSVSSDVVPIMGEYERTSTTVVNAYLAPRVIPYLRELNARLEQLGLPRPILLLQSNGGAISLDQAAERPVNLTISGPAAGVGALGLMGRTAGADNLISMEIGGTSCDVTLMSDGVVPVVDSFAISGYHLAIPAVDIHTVGAGGGTIARVDSGGMLHVGPAGAGARPGPVCYGLDGTEPTVTDAQLVLGRLRPGPYAGGSVNLDEGRAREVIERTIARPLGIEVDAAAAGIIRILEQNILHAVEAISIERGHDPRRFTLVAAGGAGPMHGAPVGRALGCGRVYVPRQAGVFCAVGMLHSDVRQDYLQVFLDDLDTVDHAAIEAGFGRLEDRATAALEAGGFGPERRRIERQIDLRYRAQQWSIRVDLRGADFAPAAVRSDFEAEHERLFGHSQPGGAVEITSLRVIGTGLIEPLASAAEAPGTAAPEPVARRAVYHDDRRGRAETAVYAGADLRPGHRLVGPLMVEEETTTVFVGPDDALEVDPANNLVIHLNGAGGGT